MKATLCFFLSFIGIQVLFAQEYYDVDQIAPALKNRANACIRLEETSIDMRAADNVLHTVKKAITVFNENGENEARLVLHYDKNTTIKSIKGEVYNAVGKPIAKFSQSDFFDISAADGFSLFLDSRIKHYLPNISDYPYTVVYNYEIRLKQNMVIPDWMPKSRNDVSVEKSVYTFICKPTDQIRIKSSNYGEAPAEKVDDKQKKLVWHVANLPAVKTEAYSPDPESYLTSIKIAPQQFTYYNHKGSYTNWKELGKWVYDDLLTGRMQLPLATVQMAKNLVKEAKTDKEKARILYQYLQNKTRYISVQIGIGGLQPVAAAEVDRLGYGDCKALVNYMQSLLNAVDIESYYCVVEAGSFKKSLDVNYTSVVQGNHIILCMPLKGDTTWLECTSQKIPFGFLSDFTDDRLVLACTPQGGKLLHTPKLTAENNLQQRRADLQITKEGNITGAMKTVYSGAQYDNQIEILDKPLSEQNKMLKKSYSINNIDFDAIHYALQKDIDPVLTEDISLNIRNYGSINGDRMFFQPNAFNIRQYITETKTRLLPLYINRGFTDEDTIVYTLPENTSEGFIANERKEFKTVFGEYKMYTKVEGNKLTYYRKLRLNDGTFPADQYAAFSKFINDVNTADNLKLALSLKK